MGDKQNKRILIYEDDQEILELCRIILTKNGYAVETMTRCENVIHDTQRIAPDLILMDLWIPEIGGEKAIRLIKEHPALRHIPVLLFSANRDIKEICKRLNADGYLEKPFDIKTFLGAVELHV